MSSIRNQNICILGLGVSGRSALRYLQRSGALLFGVDQNWDLLNENREIQELKKQGIQFLHESQVDKLDFCKALIVSPGVPPTNLIYQKALNQGIEILGEVELACRTMSNPCLAITGSNGKTTTTMLTTHVLNVAGIKARAVGNIGVPLTEALEDENGDVIVLELSSWQLETLKSKAFDAALILNITPNHLDRHGTMQAYASAKLNIREGLKVGQPLYMGSDCYATFGVHSAIPIGYDENCLLRCDQTHVWLGDEIQFTLPEKYQGKKRHDVENMLGAFALCRSLGVDGPTFLKALSTFVKPPHRIEFVKEIGGVSYFNDSKATSLEAVMKAVESMDGKTILIAGGMHKGAAYHPWAASFKGKVGAIYAIGQAAEKIEADVGGTIPVQKCKDLDEAIQCASKIAKRGENVLLSPGCSSYDMFKNYEQRGEEFKRIVLQSLPNEESEDD